MSLGIEVWDEHLIIFSMVYWPKKVQEQVINERLRNRPHLVIEASENLHCKSLGYNHMEMKDQKAGFCEAPGIFHTYKLQVILLLFHGFCQNT